MPASAPRPVPSDPTFSLPAARGPAFAALAAFGALHWMALLEPAEPGRALSALLAASVAVVGLLSAARLGGHVRQLAAGMVALAALAFGLLAGGVADEMLRPDLWGTFAAEIGRGIEAVPGVRVPYRGIDESIRIVIGIGGSTLVVLAALAAFWPRRRRTGSPAVALGLLVALYGIPTVALDFGNEFLRGAALALLVLAFLRLEKLRVSDLGTAAMVAAGIAVLALMFAPAIDSDEPWWDYERWALGAASARSTSFSWDHDYGPLDWPRDGRELLRVKARRSLYWKAANLELFDGRHWVQGDPDQTDIEKAVALAGDGQPIRVTIRNLRSETLVTAGYAGRVDARTVGERPRGDGTWAPSRPLRRGDSYTALVYEPNTNETRRRDAPLLADDELADQRRVVLPASSLHGAPPYEVLFPAFGDPGGEVRAWARRRSEAEVDAATVLGDGRLHARMYRLAQRLKNRSPTQEDFVQAVLEYLSDFPYSETPGRAAQTLDGFLFEARIGYCQQFSGAMALLLRMGGVPARVATGFTPGSLDEDTGEWVVRDLDAHSWVEVWYPGIGWETFDPTPAAAPPRSQPNDGESRGDASSADGPPSLGGDVPSDPGRRALATQEGTPWGWIGAAAVGAIALLASTGLWLRRRHRRADGPPAALVLDEFERALRRTRRHPGPGATLRTIEAAFARSPAAAGYVRAVRDLRYACRAAAPSRHQRRALRSELARSAGLVGRVRAWWALPPRAW